MNEDEGSSLLGVENEVELFELLKKRFLQDDFNSFIDDILISFNPCKTTSQENDKDNAHQKVAASTLNRLKVHRKSQCIVFTGDSGSGKTNLANKLIHCITMTTKTTEPDLAQNIIQAGEILESFGNAGTLTCSNASRFIKMTELLFTQDVTLNGACFHHYLLEKARVAHHDKDEKKFHIFYQFLMGTEPENLSETYYLEPSEYHRYTPCDFPEEKDKYQKELQHLKESFQSLGFSQDDLVAIFRFLAAMLHVGNVTFYSDGYKKTVEVNDVEPLQKASSLLRVSPEKLKFALTTEITRVKGRVARRVRSINEATNARDMIAMTVYARLFAWIVWKINMYLSPLYGRGNSLSILDPFGFERLNINSIEQLFINATNEHLMFLYNQIVFAWETADQEAEGILIQKIDFPHNKQMVDFLMERPNGIFSLLEQESKSSKSSDVSLVKVLNSKHRKHGYYSEVTNCPYPAFTINHYTGKVTYVALNIIAANRNLVGGSIITCLQESQDDLLSRLFMVKLSPTGAITRPQQKSSEEITRIPRNAEIKKMRSTTRRKAEMIGGIYGTTKAKVSKRELLQEQSYFTLTSQFRNSLSDIMQQNLQSELRFIRCIRPNQELIPNKHDDELVTAQLKYSGIMESVRMRQTGFPERVSFKDFIDRYKFLSYPLTVSVKYSSETCEKILSRVHGLGWQVGKTKILMKHYCREQLNGLLISAHHAVVVVQKLFRGRLARRRFYFLKERALREKHQVIEFLSKIISHTDFYNHLCNLVSEEDARANNSIDAKYDEDIQEKALQILDGRKITRTKLVTQKGCEETLSSTVDGPSTTQEPVSVSDIFSFGLEQTSPDIPKETEDQPASGSDDDNVFIHTDKGNEVSAHSMDTPSSITDAMVAHSMDTPSSITDAMVAHSMDTPSSITDAMVAHSMDTPSSITDAMSVLPDDGMTSPNDDLTSPVRPGLASKLSNLSTFSFDSSSSLHDDMAVAMETPGLWCVITCYEREKPRADFQVDRPVIVVDGSSNAFDISRIGLGALPIDSHDEQVQKVRRCIGKGIKLTIDGEGNMWVKRCGKNNVYVKGRFLPHEIKEVNGDLPKGKLVKVFDFESFSNLLQYECQPTRYEPTKEEDLLLSTKVYFSFVKNAIDDFDTPCWIEVKLEEPYRVTQVAFEKAKERRRVAREKRGERTPPILRAKIGKSRQIIAVGALEKRVRPNRYIDTFKYGRKRWARKAVSVNPFSYGKEDYLSPEKENTDGSPRERSLSSPEELERSSIAREINLDTSLEGEFERSSSHLETSSPSEVGNTNLNTKNNNDKSFAGIHEKSSAGQKIWAKEKLKGKSELKSKGRMRSKTAS